VSSDDGLARQGLEWRGVRAGYGKREILPTLDLELRSPEFLAVIGPNGAGKSTLLKVALGLLPPWSGTIHFRGEDITRMPSHMRSRAGLGFLPQGGRILRSLTVRENLQVSASRLPGSRQGDAIDFALRSLPQLEEKIGVRAGLLSGGYRQTLSLAMLLAGRPQVIMLDEPTAGLAPKVACEVLDGVRALNVQEGIPVVLVEQRVREALRVATRACLMVGGRIIDSTNMPTQWLDDPDFNARFIGKST
jgi:ABC-type branched-subunit amino acid transport system ATPase component